MRRASKILTLILVVVFLFGIFAGCDLIGKDTAKYRAATAFTVGSQKITVGKLLDSFNSYYNQYYFYMSYSGMTVEDVFDIAVESLYSQYMKVEAYTTSQPSKVKVAANKDAFKYAEFLTQDQLDYCVSFVKYLVINSFNTSVMEKIEAKYDLKDEETEDTSRDFRKFDDLKGAKTYADYYISQNFTDEDMDEYIEKYHGGDKSGFVSHELDKLQDLYLAGATKKVEELNARLDKDEDDDTEITIEEYQDYQKAALSQYKTSVKNSYDIDFEEFLKNQIEDLIVGGIVNLYNYDIYKGIETDTEFKSKLQENYKTLVAAQQAEFAINNNYETFIEGLSDTSFIYDVPEGRENDYVFVKNILIPFSAKQTTRLNSLKADLGTTDDARYTEYRNKLAAQIVADDFTTNKNDDGEYGKLEEKPFTLDNGNVVINPACTELSNYLHADGSVTAKPDMTNEEIIVELMKQFNTDVAQHSALYSYVVRVNAPKNYKHKWVDEFVQATEDAVKASKDAGGDGTGYYGIGVSDYGVHIVYVEGFVKADTVNFESGNFLDTKTTEYRLFKTYFETQLNKLLAEDYEKLKETYKDQVNTTKVFNKFLKENGLTYDLAAKLSNDED